MGRAQNALYLGDIRELVSGGGWWLVAGMSATVRGRPAVLRLAGGWLLHPA